jgi:hypothetical protein
MKKLKLPMKNLISKEWNKDASNSKRIVKEKEESGPFEENKKSFLLKKPHKSNLVRKKPLEKENHNYYTSTPLPEVPDRVPDPTNIQFVSNLENGSRN